jgi:hypothetical protein
MSSTLLEEVVEQPRTLDLVPLNPATGVQEHNLEDPHPLLPVFVALVISLLCAGTFVGAILLWLALRHSGVMAP